MKLKSYICFARFVAQDKTTWKKSLADKYAAISYCLYFVMKKVFGCGGLSNANKLISFRFISFLFFRFLRVTYTQDHQCVPNKYVGCLWMMFCRLLALLQTVQEKKWIEKVKLKVYPRKKLKKNTITLDATRSDYTYYILRFLQLSYTSVCIHANFLF